jgi:hypothetical protein
MITMSNELDLIAALLRINTFRTKLACKNKARFHRFNSNYDSKARLRTVRVSTKMDQKHQKVETFVCVPYSETSAKNISLRLSLIQIDQLFRPVLRQIDWKMEMVDQSSLSQSL